MRKPALLAAIVLLAAAPAAGATTVKTLSGATVPTGSSVSGSSTGPVVIGGPAGGSTCTSSSLGGTLGTNPNWPSVSASLTSLTFSGCSDTMPFVAVSSVTTNAGAASAKPLTFTYAGAASTLTISGVVFTVSLTNGTNCTYAPVGDTATARHDTQTGEYTFDVPMSRSGGTTFCVSPGRWTATYRLGVTIHP